MADFGTVARPYARAVFETANAAGDLQGWSGALAAAAAVAGDATARSYLTRPELGTTERSEFVATIAADLPGGAILQSPTGNNLLRLLAENDRLDALPEISAQFDQLKADQENKVRVTLVSASNVDGEAANKISDALGRKFGREVELEIEIDPSLIGGAVVRADDRVIDDSLRTRLQRLASTLTD